MTFQILSQPMAITGEAPLWDPVRQCLWWLDIQAQRLLRTEPDGATGATPLPWQPGLIALAESGRLVLGLETGLFLHDPENGTLDQISETEADRVTVRLNDGKPDKYGRLWFGSMDMTGEGRAIGRLYRRDTDGSIHTIRENILVPNAIAPHPDGTGLTFVDTPTRRLEFLETDPVTGTVLTSKIVHEFTSDEHPDGACFDQEGNLWIAVIGRGDIRKLSLENGEFERIGTPVTRPTMPILGGPDGQTLFVTNQRRFLDSAQLNAQTAAGGLLVKERVAEASILFRVGGL
ncbi:L-arabinolactonase [Labrenzia sp. THAF35]|uniref:SMP-30/gluconolactonase/LRE family protein n=1 Tax=Labrenzia sp. THAF35 TaxID=2587854 RepID=UPI0012695C3B|nr:SMP-30/gluconolactonase/LRE family protein [Labrenzia sp. THAF35]MEC9418966.1 SMP-30/gluconolactonase/LRE family protein [Pseudomonadota bacterium]QFT67901.1 L-arabinolactonase [Labrenzia sp. THAF35]